MKAVITSGNKQYLVAKDDVLEIDLLDSEKKTLSFEPLLVINETETLVGAPTVAGHTVTAEVLGETRGEKVLAIRYKAKKRVKKVHGSKQTYTQIKITAVK
jgi:large subunit ribosomal protein L21